jgi:hypothetical protein
MICSAIILARFDGIANPNPSASALPRIISVFIPITSPAKFISGPPELPLLIAASVWINL